MSPTLVGLVAGALTGMAAIPQLAKTLRTRHARDISVWQPLLLSTGIALWIVYGMLIHNLPLILTNIIPLVCNILLTGLKFHYRDNAA
ncbi:MAG: SemiSWEET transporter [Oryzomonas sp.]|uniref:SemiSWEET family sugar transporter n=1 Tax=Oryzomonas sp. TaxID=2855186 RepID=UPI00284FE618|nr:SemiSWEET transporter [Oryzomonas sp.]MDR3579841.1 SemiSWEET transporter [Oryzomonas sp.]